MELPNVIKTYMAINNFKSYIIKLVFLSHWGKKDTCTLTLTLQATLPCRFLM